MNEAIFQSVLTSLYTKINPESLQLVYLNGMVCNIQN